MSSQSHKHYGGAAISFIEGDITEQHVDVIVNSTTSSLDHSIGPLAKAISEGAGEELTEECKRKCPKGISNGDIAETSACQLPCQFIYHVSLGGWSTDPSTEQNLRDLIQKLLTRADDNGFRSISMPAIGTGVLQYPPDVVAKCMFETAIAFSPMSICEIVFVVLEKKREIVKAYQTEQNKHTQLKHSPVLGSSLNVSVIKGDIANEDVEVIVNSTTTSLGLSSGPVSRAILKAGGDSLQQECKTKYPTGIKNGEIAETSGGNLKCQSVYHIALGSWSEESCCEVIMKCLEKASEDGKKSIAFPMLGTGVLSYPRDGVTKCFFDSFDSFGTDNPGSLLTDARVVVYSEDGDKIQIFGEVEATRKELFAVETVQLRTGVSAGAIEVPKNWRPMSARAMPKEISLSSMDREYIGVARRFQVASRYQNTIVKIERIQNRKLYLQYELFRDDTSKKNPNMTVDRSLWHGTTHEAVPKINTNGFSRSYCSHTAYGHGTYFAVNSSTSVSFTSANCDGHRHIYEAAVVVGHYTKGEGGMKAPPPRDKDKPEILYDTVVDNVDNPTMFVVFNDVQAYPKYLITFK